jgi:hypothetical protein
MTVLHLHVERLVLDGVGGGSADAARVAAALRTGLARSLASEPLTCASRAVDRAVAAPIEFGDGRAGTIGARLAASVDGAVRAAAARGAP